MVGAKPKADKSDVGVLPCSHRADLFDVDLACDHLVAESCDDLGEQLEPVPPLVRDQDAEMRYLRVAYQLRSKRQEADSSAVRRRRSRPGRKGCMVDLFVRVLTIGSRVSAGLRNRLRGIHPQQSGRNGFEPATTLGRQARDLEGGTLVEMRIVVPDAASATVLADRLTATFGSERISLRRERREVDVLIDPEPEPAVLRVLDAVEGWIDQARVGSVEMWLGERSYRIARWVPAESWQ
jgi:hypothetical protein